ncbi:hypothetical protein CY35_14G083300 [Sphagnum magellanicum]|nr:hypothetical protein CY35_14G083300 [Sphagnum magellanicum]
MAASGIVDKATSDMLIGPDWVLNLELCDVINSDPMQSRDVIKAVKKRLSNRNPVVQLLALTVLETLIKNCGENVHQQVAEKDVLYEMVKIVKKKADMHVRDKVLVLLDSWQEAFGGSRGRYPQYYMAYNELQKLGMEFPQRGGEHTVPIFTPPQSQSIPYTYTSASYSNQRSPGMLSPRPEPNDNLPVMRDEELLRQGLSLNDDLQHVLAKHDAIASGSPLLKDIRSQVFPVYDNDKEGPGDQLSHRPSSHSRPVSGVTGTTPRLKPSAPELVPPPPQTSSKKSSVVDFGAVSASPHGSGINLLSGEPIIHSTDQPSVAAQPTTTTAQLTMTTVSLVATPLIDQYRTQLALLALPAPEDETNPFGTTTFQAIPSTEPPSYATSQQLRFLTHHHSDGNMSPPSHSFHQQPVFHQLAGIPPNNYAAPWSTASLATEHVLTPQQRALIYGETIPASQKSPPGQQASGQDSANQQPPQGQQLYGHQELPLPHTPPPWQDEVQPPKQQGGYRALSPWGGVNGPQPWNTQQQDMMYGPQLKLGSAIPPPPGQHVQQQQSGQGSSTTYRTVSSGNPQVNLSGQKPNLSLQDASQYMQNQPIGGQYKQSVAMPSTSPPKPLNPADKLFEDLVDLRSVNAKFKAAGIVGSLSRPSTSKAGP